MPTLRIPTPLRAYTGGQAEVPVQGDTAGDTIADLVERYPALKQHLFNGDGGLRPFVNVFLGEENVKDLQGLATPIQAQDRLLIIPSIAGGVDDDGAGDGGGGG